MTLTDPISSFTPFILADLSIEFVPPNKTAVTKCVSPLPPLIQIYRNNYLYTMYTIYSHFIKFHQINTLLKT